MICVLLPISCLPLAISLCPRGGKPVDRPWAALQRYFQGLMVNFMNAAWRQDFLDWFIRDVTHRKNRSNGYIDLSELYDHLVGMHSDIPSKNKHRCSSMIPRPASWPSAHPPPCPTSCPARTSWRCTKASS